MKKLPSLSWLTFLALFNANVNASMQPLDLGLAGNFNAFVLGDMTANNSDVEGSLAVGGNLKLNNYAIGMQLDSSFSFQDTLVVGGNIDFTEGRIYQGNARSGGTANIVQVGFYSDDPNSPNGAYQPGLPIDFEQVKQDLINRSLAWGGWTANGQTNWQNGFLTLKGENSGLNIFSVSANQLETHTFTLDIPENSTALINVFGEMISLHNFGSFKTINGEDIRIPDISPENRHDGSMTQNVLFNLVEATTIEMYSIGLKGSLLAPLAELTFYDGHIDGSLIVGSLTGLAGELSGQINHYPFLSDPSNPPSSLPISEPSIFSLISCFFIALIVVNSFLKKT